MAKFDRIKPGDVLWDCHRRRMGNTTMSRMACFPVTVVEVDHEAGFAICRWNDNPPKKFWAASIARLRRTPVKERDPFGRDT